MSRINVGASAHVRGVPALPTSILHRIIILACNVPSLEVELPTKVLLRSFCGDKSGSFEIVQFRRASDSSIFPLQGSFFGCFQCVLVEHPSTIHIFLSDLFACVSCCKKSFYLCALRSPIKFFEGRCPVASSTVHSCQWTFLQVCSFVRIYLLPGRPSCWPPRTRSAPFKTAFIGLECSHNAFEATDFSIGLPRRSKNSESPDCIDMTEELELWAYGSTPASLSSPPSLAEGNFVQMCHTYTFVKYNRDNVVFCFARNECMRGRWRQWKGATPSS